MDVGVITAIGSDQTTVTAQAQNTDGTWTVGTSDLEIIFTGYNLDTCECPPCIGYEGYSPMRENSMYKDGVCLEYCDEEVIARGGNVYEPYKAQDGEYWLSHNLDLKSKLLYQRADNIFAFERRNDSGGDVGEGTNGLFVTLENRATKFEGEITTLEDLEDIAAIVKRNGISEATIFATQSQYKKLMKIVNLNPGIQWDPFVNHQSDLLYLGYKGIDMYGTKLFFKEWSAMDSKNASVNLTKRYPFVVVPMDRLTRVINGKTYNTGHLAVAYFGNERKVYKHLRIDDNPTCDNFKIQYVNKFTPLIFFPERFILGVGV